MSNGDLEIDPAGCLPDDGTAGTELWKSDGTAAGTVMVKEIAPGGFAS